MEKDYNQYVHEGVGDYRGRWFVAIFKDGWYHTPVRKAFLSGVPGGVLRISAKRAPEVGYSYKRRSDALRKARELYGD